MTSLSGPPSFRPSTPPLRPSTPPPSYEVTANLWVNNPNPTKQEKIQKVAHSCLTSFRYSTLGFYLGRACNWLASFAKKVFKFINLKKTTSTKFELQTPSANQALEIPSVIQSPMRPSAIQAYSHLVDLTLKLYDLLPEDANKTHFKERLMLFGLMTKNHSSNVVTLQSLIEDLETIHKHKLAQRVHGIFHGIRVGADSKKLQEITKTFATELESAIEILKLIAQEKAENQPAMLQAQAQIILSRLIGCSTAEDKMDNIESVFETIKSIRDILHSPRRADQQMTKV